MSDDFFVCEHCLSDNELRAEIIERGTPVADCKICRRTGGRALQASDSRVKRIFRALVRLNFSEWDYNSHLGGDSLQRLVFEGKCIFDLGPEASIEDFEETVLVMEDGWYPENPEGIALGGGYWDGHILNGLRHARDVEVQRMVREAFSRNYFNVAPQVKDLLESIRGDIASILSVGSEYVRGRIGVKSRMRKAGILPPIHPSYHYLPFTGADIGPPPLERATEGRLNRARVSVLYLASDHQTAVAELRPHPGHLVSTSIFRLKKDISVANFASHDIRNFLNDERLEILRRILSFADVMNLPVQPEQQALYVVTQLFADSVREAGYDAVTYKSSVADGMNVTCFKDDAFEIVPGSEQVREVTGLQYGVIDAKTPPQDFSPDEFHVDDDDPFASLLHGMARRSAPT